MCWKSSKEPVLMVAERDISVEKVLRMGDNGVLSSPIRTLNKWKLGEVMYTSITERNFKEEDFYQYIIRLGFHSCAKIINSPRYDVVDYWVSLYGDAKEYELFYADDGEVVCEAIIPSGSRYYLNEYGEYVSDSLKIVRIKEETKVNLKK